MQIKILVAEMAVKRILKGGTAFLSTSQLCKLLIDVRRAKRKLGNEEFKKVFHCYCMFRGEKHRQRLNKFNFTEPIRRIVYSFDSIAPFELYCRKNISWVQRFL